MKAEKDAFRAALWSGITIGSSLTTVVFSVAGLLGWCQ